MNNEAFNEPIVIDVGSGLIKAGLAGDDVPSLVFPAVVGRSSLDDDAADAQVNEVFVGDIALAKVDNLKITYPIAHGRVTDWEGFEALLRNTFSDELKRNPEEHPVLLAVAPLTSETECEKMAGMLFKTFGCPACYFENQAALSLYASGRTTGIVVDIGDDVSHIVPVYEGVTISVAVESLVLGGRDLTNYLMRLLVECGYPILNHEVVSDIKEKICYVAENYEEKLKVSSESSAIEYSYEIPSGEVIVLNKQRFECPEALFQPSMLNKDLVGMHQRTYEVIMGCVTAKRVNLFGNIILSGGSSMFPGIQERFTSELEKLASSNSKVKVIAPPERKFSSWIGGSILGALPGFSSEWVTKEEYDQEGFSVVRRKCKGGMHMPFQ